MKFIPDLKIQPYFGSEQHQCLLLALLFAACYFLETISVCARMSQIRAKLLEDSEGSHSCTAGAQPDQTGTCPPASLQEQFCMKGAQEKLSPGTKIFLILILLCCTLGLSERFLTEHPKSLNHHFASNGLHFQWNIPEHTISIVNASLGFKASPVQLQVAKPEGWIWKASCIHFTELLLSDAALLVLLATHYLNTTILGQWTHIQVSLHWSLKPDSEKANELLCDPHAPDLLQIPCVL